MVKKISKVFKSRLVLVGLAILLQMLWWVVFMGRLTSYSIFFNTLFRLISIGILLYLIRKDENSAYKIAWIILVMGVPPHRQPLSDGRYGGQGFGACRHRR